MKAVKLYFKTPLRSGEAGLGLEGVAEVIHSDTLFAAIANALIALNEDVNEFIEKVKAGEIKLSSCFPFNGDTYYLPAPQIPVEHKIGNFVSKETFEKIISGDNELKLEKEELDFIEKYEVPKVSLDRSTSNSNIYYMSATRFREGAGLYFVVDGYCKLLDHALKYLGDDGIGGKKTWGLGRFEHKAFNFTIKSKGDKFVTLSLTYPTNKDSVMYWKPVIRSGWVNSKNGSFRKPKLIMALEGSIFNEYEEGRLVDLDEADGNFSGKVGHKVYANGKSFLIPAVIQ
ncbi:CRISPR type III-A/MTUBE-associated RAMP protein Csm4 [Archaeoglobus fulgidus DSM 8774]|uniref:CRISPR system Cms protein Csm4 n=1 Tax=Archaeoglobus fulgidus DSM 8774 TaxID=1344584 RepID=A0A075WBU6_ARCFL|nr:type III-A CRISPR-associated RAMP protein Csm4 [Archaeoglobus fulgidus]AIG97431.1 CRISPR type III-A/MTUBE-associated RAMP protein Csm4 [Archaeoglobus fulgidus DSM 8774]